MGKYTAVFNSFSPPRSGMGRAMVPSGSLETEMAGAARRVFWALMDCLSAAATPKLCAAPPEMLSR